MYSIKDKTKTHSVVTQLEVEADSYAALKSACAIALLQHQAEGFRVKEGSLGPDILEILWSVDRSNNPLSNTGEKFISKISDPEELADMIFKWLRQPTRYSKCEEYDTDGDLGEGFILTTFDLSDWRVMFSIIPNYTIYGK